MKEAIRGSHTTVTKALEIIADSKQELGGIGFIRDMFIGCRTYLDEPLKK